MVVLLLSVSLQSLNYSKLALVFQYKSQLTHSILMACVLLLDAVVWLPNLPVIRCQRIPKFLLMIEH